MKDRSDDPSYQGATSRSPLYKFVHHHHHHHHHHYFCYYYYCYSSSSSSFSSSSSSSSSYYYYYYFIFIIIIITFFYYLFTYSGRSANYYLFYKRLYRNLMYSYIKVTTYPIKNSCSRWGSNSQPPHISSCVLYREGTVYKYGALTDCATGALTITVVSLNV